MNFLRKIALLVLMLAVLASCFRYVPSRREMEKKYEDGNVAQGSMGGPEQFRAHEQKLRQRLKELLEERAPMLDRYADYRLGPSDVVKVNVFGFPDLSGSIPVNSDGMLSLALVGDIRASGLSITELRNNILLQMRKYVRRPRLQVTLERHSAHRVWVVGSVVKPGSYPLKDGVYLLTEILAEAGIRKEDAGNRIVIIPASMRSSLVDLPPLNSAGVDTSSAEFASLGTSPTVLGPVDSFPTGTSEIGSFPVALGSVQNSMITLPPIELSSERARLSEESISVPLAMSGAGPMATASFAVEIDREDLRGTADTPPLLIPLRSGDTVFVPPPGRYKVDGEVLKPGSFLLSSRTTTLGAIAAAGGFSYAADVHEVEVIRDIGGGKKASVTVDLEKVAFQGASDVRLRDGDYVLVPSSPGRFGTRQVFEAFRSLFRGGMSPPIKY